MSTVSIGLGTVPCMIGTSAVAAPVVVAPVAPADSTTAGDGTPIAASKSRPAGPKIAFPTTHLNELYTLIHGNSKIQTDLVSQLRQHFESVTSKAAIEAKIKEVAFREGKTKDSKWKVKAEAWVSRRSRPCSHSSVADRSRPLPVSYRPRNPPHRLFSPTNPPLDTTRISL